MQQSACPWRTWVKGDGGAYEYLLMQDVKKSPPISLSQWYKMLGSKTGTEKRLEVKCVVFIKIDNFIPINTDMK